MGRLIYMKIKIESIEQIGDKIKILFMERNRIRFTMATPKVVEYIRKRNPEFIGFEVGQELNVIPVPYKDSMGYKIAGVL